MKKVKSGIKILLKRLGFAKFFDKIENNFKANLVYASWLSSLQSQFDILFEKMCAFESQWNQTKMDTEFASYASVLRPSMVQAVVSSHMHIADLVENFSLQPPPHRKNQMALKPGGRILFVTGVFPSVNHGGGLRVFDLIQELHLLGYEVHLYSVSPTENETETLHLLKDSLRSMTLVPMHEFNEGCFERYLQKNNHIFDVGYFVWPTAVDLMAVSRNRIHKKVFEFIEVTSLRMWMDLLFVFRNRQSKKPAIFSYFLTALYYEKKATLLADELVALTEKDASFVETTFAVKNISIIKTGLSRAIVLDKIKNAPQERQQGSVVFIGNYDHYPNLDGIRWYLKNVHAAVLEKVPDYKLYVMGKGPLEFEKNEFQNFGHSIEWVGPVDDPIFSMAPMQVCIAPLISGAGLRGKVNQYASLGKPIVATTIATEGTPYRHAESIYVADQPEIFAEKVIAFLNNAELSKEFGQKAYDVVHQNFKWDQPIQDLLKIL